MFKLAFLSSALVTAVYAANFKRVTCPDGVNTATNEAVSFNVSSRHKHDIDPYFKLLLN